MVDGHRTNVSARRFDSIKHLFECEEQGAFMYARHDGIDDAGLVFVCPCGCGQICTVNLKATASSTGPIWGWDGNREAPTLSPSIRRLDGCKWHGHLVGGVWQPCADSGQ